MGFLILEHLHTAFHCGYACLSSHQLYPRVPFPPNSRQNVLSLLFLTIATPTSVIFVLLLCISSIINDIEQLFILLFSSVQLLSRVWLFVTPWSTKRQATLSITNSWVYLNSSPLSRWCHPTISFSVVPFSSCFQSFPASGSFQISQLFAWSSQNIGVSASASVLPMNTQDWSPLGWTGCFSLQSKGLSRVFSNTTLQKHQFFCAQLYSPTLTSIHEYWKNNSLDEMDLCW